MHNFEDWQLCINAKCNTQDNSYYSICSPVHEVGVLLEHFFGDSGCCVSPCCDPGKVFVPAILIIGLKELALALRGLVSINLTMQFVFTIKNNTTNISYIYVYLI